MKKKTFLDQPVKNKQKGYETLFEMSRNNDYTAGNLLGYLYHQNYYKLIDTGLLIGIDLLRQTNASIHQQINFVETLDEYDGVTIFLSLKSSKKLF